MCCEFQHLFSYSKFISIFAARCNRSLCYDAVSVCACPSVCLSVTFVSCVTTNKHIIKLFPPSGSHAILVFSVPNGMAIFRRKPPPLTGASNAGGVGRNRDPEPIGAYLA